MSVVADYDDMNEWSLFGGQLLDVSSSLAMVDSWPDAMPDSSEVAMPCNVDIDDVGIMSSLKVLSCPVDEGEFIDFVKDCDSVSNSSTDAVPCGAARSSVSTLEAWQNSSICGTRLVLPDLAQRTMKMDGNRPSTLSRYLHDVDFVGESVLECVNDAEVEELVSEYSDLVDVCGNLEPSHTLASHNTESLSSYDDDNDSALSGSSTFDQESLMSWQNGAVGFSKRGVERRVRKKEQNKTAALRYRMKKRIERGSMQQEYNALMAQNVELKAKVQQMTREITYLNELITEMQG